MDVVELFETHANQLRKFARNLCRNDSMSDDLVQDTFVKAMTNIGLLQGIPGPKVKSWLFTTLKNGFLDSFRRRKRFETATEEWDEFPDETEFETTVDNSILVASLPQPTSDIVFKKFWLNMNASEIAQELSMPPGTVRYHLHNGLRELRRKLEIDGEQ